MSRKCRLTELTLVTIDPSGAPVVKAAPLDFDAIMKVWTDWFALSPEDREKRLAR